MKLINTENLRMLEKAVDAASLRQRVIANNIANVDTPNFKRSYVSFEDVLAEALNPPTNMRGVRTDPKHLPIGADRASKDPNVNVHTDTSKAMNNNLNNVDIEYEMALMAKNNLRYNVLVQKLNGDLKSLRTAIEGR